ncbi:YsnF/AvaK domain-containing protein [Dyadobacter sandarakinus]|uniref:DUF2382 domain-containing protein n=1 Tax=Dyadobacter sandarakinus TaxID=2747268 RepID=A0ABX7IBR4_9BACT|nr:DUF2382 domain-containing protein [Dyadobacter sandarakinus]QRR03263.1 DUF2382 domain-containing protein [Dyadobacter sandarakinus]
MIAGQDHDTGSFPASESLKLPVIEEKLVVGSQLVETGKVTITKEVVEEEVSVNGLISSEEVLVERREINQYVEYAPEPIRQEGNVTIISVVKEVLVVEKKLMLVEELHITKRETQEEKTFSQTLKKEIINVSRENPGTDI